jgi:alpha-beta hydrolase superfamily lysophospholipase
MTTQFWTHGLTDATLAYWVLALLLLTIGIAACVIDHTPQGGRL